MCVYAYIYIYIYIYSDSINQPTYDNTSNKQPNNTIIVISIINHGAQDVRPARPPTNHWPAKKGAQHMTFMSLKSDCKVI